MDICRVCLYNENNNKYPIGDVFDNRTIAEMIEFCCGIEVSVGDNYPQVVCSKCLVSLEKGCRVKQICQKSDEILRNQILKNATTESKSHHNLIFCETISRSECCDSKNKPSASPETRRQKINQTRSQTREKIDHKTNQKLIIKCYLCNMKFSNKNEKIEHLKEFHAIDELKCKLCKHKSQTIRGLDNHMMLHEKPDLLLHMCHICGKKNYQKACELRRHIKLTHGDKSKRQIKFHCDHCDFKTFSKMNMKRHLSTIHLKIRAFGCQLCPDKKYTSKITLDQHMISKHGQETDFVCQCCHRKFPTMSFLRSHLKSSCSGNPGSVRERGNPNEYREPLLDGFDNYRCKLCGLIFVGKGKIAQHFAQKHKHDNSCHLCSAKFNSYSNLKKHIQILHNKVHKYTCDYCSRSFGQKNQFQSHINTHTGDKPFQCKFDFCSFRSGDLSAISKHQKKCTNNPANKFT